MQISIANAIQVARRIGAAAAEVITTNLKMWLGFETSSIDGDEQITPDKSGNNNVGELFTGKALEFDGNLDSVTFTSYPTSIKSVVFWYKPLASQSFDSIIWLGGVSRGTISISNNQGTIICTNLLGKVSYVNGVQTESVTLNQWQRVVINFPSKTLLGLSFAKVGTNYGDCQLSDIQFYNENLSLDDIAYDYANPQKLLTEREGTLISSSNLRGYWHLSEGSGSVVYDSSGKGNNGTISGATYEPAQPRIPQLGMMNFSNGAVATGVTLIPDPNNTSQDILGNAVRDRLNSFNLDGSGYAEVADDADFDIGTGDFSVEAWVKFQFKNQGSSFNVIYSNGGEFNDTNSFGLATKNGNLISFLVNNTSCNSTSTFSLNEWVHVVGTRIQGTNGVKLYINGNTTPEDTTTNNNTVTNSFDKTVGYDTHSSRYYNNIISDVRLYDRALTSGEIQNNYKAGLSAHTND